MAQKPEIQYIGQFYVHGSEAKALELKQKQEQKKAKTELPQHRYERIRKVQVDLLAIGSLLMATLLLVTMVAGALSLETAWRELATAKQYVYELQDTNRTLTASYRASYDLEQVRSTALAMGLIPEEEAVVMKLYVSVPEAEPERTWLDDFIWFVEGLFA